MSVCAIANRRILHNITNMDENQAETTLEKASSDMAELADAPSKAEPTPPPLDAATSTAALPGGENGSRRSFDDVDDEKDRIKAFLKSFGNYESGNRSKDQQQRMQVEDRIDPTTKKRKTRRGKPKRGKLKPYSRQVPKTRCTRNRQGAGKTKGQPRAPYNTNQFLIEDHNEMPDLEQKLANVTTSGFPPGFPKPPRTRDSSFSIDSNEDYFYSSPEDEEEFLTKEFFTAYEDLHVERLGSMAKSELIQEYIQLEAKMDLLTKRLRDRSMHQSDEEDMESKSDPESVKKLKTYQQQIDELIQQNEKLRRENEKLLGQRMHGSPMLSVDSESDSDSSSNGNRSACCECHCRESSYQRREKQSISSVDSSSSNDCAKTERPQVETLPI